MVPEYTDVELSIGGVPVPASNVRYTQKAAPKDEREPLPPLRFEASFEVDGAGLAWLGLWMLSRLDPQRGASIYTLTRRATYGGRKGLRAAHRLVALGYQRSDVDAWIRRGL